MDYWLLFKIIDYQCKRRLSDDGEKNSLKGAKENEEETVPVEQVKCLVLKDEVEEENDESSGLRDKEEGMEFAKIEIYFYHFSKHPAPVQLNLLARWRGKRADGKL